MAVANGWSNATKNEWPSTATWGPRKRRKEQNDLKVKAKEKGRQAMVDMEGTEEKASEERRRKVEAKGPRTGAGRAAANTSKISAQKGKEKAKEEKAKDCTRWGRTIGARR